MHSQKDHGRTVQHLSTVEARSGSRTRVTRNILAISLFLIVLLFVAALIFGFSSTRNTGADAVSADNTAHSQGQ